MSRRFKSRKRRKGKKILLLFIIFIFYAVFGYFTDNIKLKRSNELLIKQLLYSMTSTYNLSETTIYSLIKSNFKKSFNSPEYILKSELQYMYKEKSNIEENNFSYIENNIPEVYIYNSHQGEEYSSKYLEDYNILPSVLTAAYMLQEKLNIIGVKTIVEENSILEYMKKNNLNHSQSYIASRYFLVNALNKYNSINLFIDLHRDSVNHDATTINIDGKDYAKIMFVIGLKYDTYEENLSITEKLNDKINNKYPGISRGILKKDNIGANGIYNQDLNPNIILIELGGYENNIDEINNTLDILSSIIGEYLNEKE